MRAWFYARYVLLYPFRSRLRCPYCASVGTYKPHPPVRSKGVPRRFLCKACGRYENEYGRREDCVIDKARGVWSLPEDCVEPLPTPRQMFAVNGIDPWRG